MTPIVVVEVAPAKPANNRELAALLSACSRALPQGSCELRSNRPASEAPLAVASVVWDPDGNVVLSVRLRDAAHDSTRELTFERQDPELQRWRSAGLTIATIVDELEVKQEAEHAAAAAGSTATSAADNATQPAGSVTKPPAPQSKPPSPAETPAAAAPVATGEHTAERAPFVSATHLELGGLGGSGLTGGRWRGGIYAGGAHDLAGMPVFANVTVGYLLSDTGGEPSVTWTVLGLGGGVYWIASPVRLELNAELQLVLTSASARAPGTNALDTNSRWLPGAAVGARGLWPARGPLSVLVGAEGDWSARQVLITNAGQQIGRAPTYKVGFVGGLRFSF